jgi:Zn-dependent peptidase ImmA (M78 family)/DNA-binding XRE family transcriptional regulator
MGERIEAMANPELLVWARTTAGYSIEEAAKRAQINSARLSAWEAGSARPTIVQLRRLAEIYKRPFAVFYLPEPPHEKPPLHDFRRIDPATVTGASPELLFEVRRARFRRAVALDLFRDLELDVPRLTIRARSTDDPEHLAGRLRDVIGVSLETQFSWKNISDAFRGWRTALEDLGVLVFQAGGIELEEMRGLSIGEHPLPVIVVNSKDALAGRIFTMLHEMVHLTLRHDGLCDLMEVATHEKSADRKIEAFCNRVAGAMLVPEASLRNEPLVVQHRGNFDWGDEELGFLSRRYRVSRETALRRLVILGKASEAFYQRKREQYQIEYDLAEPSSGFASPDTLAVSRAGNLFVRLVLDGYRNEVITSNDAAEYLGVQVKHFPKIEEAVAG